MLIIVSTFLASLLLPPDREYWTNRYPFCWPPSWTVPILAIPMSILFGMILTGTATSWFPKNNILFRSSSALIFLFFGSAIYWANYGGAELRLGISRWVTPGIMTSAINKSDVTQLDGQDFLNWIENEDPISDERFDFFQSAQVADEVFDSLKLSEIDNGGLRSIVLLGEVGSGKSSVGRLVATKLRSAYASKVNFRSVGLWSYSDGPSAAAGILTEVTSCINREIDMLSLQGLSREYAKAIDLAGTTGTLLNIALQRQRTPQEIVQVIDDILAAIGKHLVVWVDDMERFQSIDTATNEIGPVLALLESLHSAKNLTVIIATVAECKALDYTRMASHLILMPENSPTKFWKIIEKFITETFEQSPLLRCADPNSNIPREFWMLGDIQTFMPGEQVDNSHRRTGMARNAAFQDIIRTPRLIKAALRWTLKHWGRLAGEFDFNDLLMLGAIRARIPRAIQWCGENRSALRDQAQKIKVSDGTLRLPQDESSFEAKLPDLQTNSLRILLQGLFGRTYTSTQGVANQSVDYWPRLQAGRGREHAHSDQEILQAINEASDGDSTALLRMMHIKSLRPLVVNLGMTADTGTLLAILKKTTSNSIGVMNTTKPLQEKWEPVLSIVAELVVQQIDDIRKTSIITDALVEVGKQCAENSIAMSAAFITILTFHREEHLRRKNWDPTDTFGDSFLEHLVNGNSDDVTRSLQSESPYSLREVMHGIGLLRMAESGNPPQIGDNTSWKNVSDRLLQLAAEDQSFSVVKQLLPLTTELSHPRLGGHPILRNNLSEYFDEPTLQTIIRRTIAPQELRDDTLAMWNPLQEWASEK